MLSKFKENKKVEAKDVEEMQYVVFLVDDQQFGVDITQAREIISDTELTFIPNAPDFVKGVINLRGEIVPVIDLNKRLSLKNSNSGKEDQKVIIVELRNNLIGMKVKEVKEIIRLTSEDIEQPPEITRSINRDYVAGVGKLDDRLLILLNLKKVLSKEEIRQIEEMEEAEVGG